MSRHQFTIQKVQSKREGGGIVSLGTRQAICALFGKLNTAPEVDGGDVLYGPGIRVELTMSGESVESIELSVTEEELFAMLFEGTPTDSIGKLARLVKVNGWYLYNLETGQRYPSIVRDDDDDDDDD